MSSRSYESFFTEIEAQLASIVANGDDMPTKCFTLGYRCLVPALLIVAELLQKTSAVRPTVMSHKK